MTIGIRPASGVLPEAVRSQKGVSTHSTHSHTPSDRDILTPPIALNRAVRMCNQPHWYVLRTTYGREQKAYDYLTSKGITAYYPTIDVVKEIRGKRTKVTESRLPNLFFAFGTEAELKTYVYDNVNLPYLRFYYGHHRVYGGGVERVPMIVPERQMQSLRIICQAEAQDIIVSADEIRKFRKGQLVRITQGEFAGVTGRVTRFKGQQRVGLYIEGLLTVATAYVPSAYLEYVGDNDTDKQ